MLNALIDGILKVDLRTVLVDALAHGVVGHVEGVQLVDFPVHLLEPLHHVASDQGASRRRGIGRVDGARCSVEGLDLVEALAARVDVGHHELEAGLHDVAFVGPVAVQLLEVLLDVGLAVGVDVERRLHLQDGTLDAGDALVVRRRHAGREGCLDALRDVSRELVANCEELPAQAQCGVADALPVVAGLRDVRLVAHVRVDGALDLDAQ